MNIGNLYLVKEWFWLLFSSKKTAAAAYSAAHARAANTGAAAAPRAATYAAYCSKHFNCEVTYFSPGSYVVFLEEDGKFKRVLTAEGKIGWTVFVDDYNDSFEEAVA